MARLWHTILGDRPEKLPSGVQARYTGLDGGTHKAPHTFPDELFVLGWLADKRREMLSHWLSQCDAAVATDEIRETSLVTYAEIGNQRILNQPSWWACPQVVDGQLNSYQRHS